MSKTEKKDTKNLPMSLKAAAEASRQKTLKTEVIGESIVKFRQGRIQYRGADVGSDLAVVVLASTTERSFYARDYDPDNIVAPDCFAIGDDRRYLSPHANVKEPANDSCRDCPLAEFGTAARGKGPACKTYRRLALLPVTALSGGPDDIARAELATCKVSPTSVDNWAAYATESCTVSGMPISAQVTQITCMPHAKKMHEITFAPGDSIQDPEIFAAVLARESEAQALIAQPYTYEEAEETPAASKKY